MNEQAIDALVESLERMAVKMGANSYEAGLRQAISLGSWLMEFMDGIKTKEQLRSALRSIDMASEETQRIVQFAATRFPAMLKMSADHLAGQFISELPRVPTGRSYKASESKRQEILDNILKLYGKQRVPLLVAKRRTAQKFEISLRTVDRYWAKRGQQDQTVSLSEVRSWIDRQFSGSAPRASEDSE